MALFRSMCFMLCCFTRVLWMCCSSVLASLIGCVVSSYFENFFYFFIFTRVLNQLLNNLDAILTE